MDWILYIHTDVWFTYFQETDGLRKGGRDTDIKAVEVS